MNRFDGPKMEKAVSRFKKVRMPKYREILKTSPRQVMNSLDRLFGTKMVRNKFKVWD